MFYTILDLSAVLKHSYYASQAPDKMYCEVTDSRVTRWESAANAFLGLYAERLQDPRFTIAAVDRGTEYRSAFLPEYKANRAKTKEEQSPLEQEQYKLFKDWAMKFLVSLGVTLVGVDGVEGDDVIAWLCQAEGMSAHVLTVDADLIQLVSEDITVELKGEQYNEGDTYKGVPHNCISVVKSMTGDTSDNYKGVPGLGPKGVEKIVAEIGWDGIKDLEDVVENSDLATLELACQQLPDLKPLHLLLTHWETWREQWRIAKLHPELCWKPRGGKLIEPTWHKRVPNAETTRRLLAEASALDLTDFSMMKQEVYGLGRAQWLENKDNVIAEMLKSDIVAFDYESTDKAQIEAFRKAGGSDFVDVLSQEISGVSFCFGAHLQYVIYLPVDHRGADNLTHDDLRELFTALQGRPARCRLVAQNFAFEGVLTQKELGMQLDKVWDTRVMQRYVNENASAGLKDMSLEYLGYRQDSYRETLEASGVTRMCDLTLEQVLKYGTDDSLVTAHLCDYLELRLALEHQLGHYKEWCIEPTQAIQSAFLQGSNINWALQKRLHDQDLETVKDKMTELRQILSANVTGEETEGFKSYIEAEKEYVRKKARDKGEDASEAFSAFRKKFKTMCAYFPYIEEEVMPKFAFTAKQLNAVAEVLDLDPIEKVAIGYLGDYLDSTGITAAEGGGELTPEQTEFLTTLMDALAARVDKLSKEFTEERQKAFDKLAEVCQRLAGVEPKIVKAGDELNVGSSDQMRGLMYCKIGVPVRLFGTTLGEGRMKLGIRQAAPATDEKAIQTALAEDVEQGSWQQEALNALLDIKKANTRINLFHNKMPLWRHTDGKVHPYITDSGTDTRRPTGNSPNILQMPGHGDGAFMRSMYMPPNKDWVCVAIDFSGQELRILASESNDAAMIEAYTPGQEKDIHSMTGVGIIRNMLRGAPELETISDFYEFNAARKDQEHEFFHVADKVRAKAKQVNFGLSYGAAAPTLARNLIVPLKEAEELMEGALKLYSRLQPWQEETSKFMTQNGYTVTAFGTRRHATEKLFSRDKGEVSRQHRQGVNFTIQGCAAESLKTILTKLHTEGWLYRLRMQFMAPIYDEIVSWVHKDDVVEYWEVMKRLMTEATPPGHIIPQVPELSIGGDWGNCVELGANPTEEKILSTVQLCLEKEAEVWETDMKVSYEEVYGTGGVA